MKLHRFGSALLAVMALIAVTVRAADTATVKRDKVNVRGQASLAGEVITQLARGETVTILEEIQAKKAKKGEPAKWAKIQLPANTPVWVFAPYIEPENKTVNVSKVNLRGGPGENYSILGRIERGAAVKEIRTVNGWMEIEAPPTAFAFVSMEYLDAVPGSATAAAAPATNAPAATTAQTAPPPPVTTTVQVAPSEPAPTAPVDASKPEEKTPPAETSTPVVITTPPPIVPAPTSTVPQVEPAAPAEPEAKRIVIREGIVVYSRSVQAPTQFALESKETHRLVNYLHTEIPGLNIKAFAGRKVVVTGEELLDARWARTPILEVEDIQVAK